MTLCRRSRRSTCPYRGRAGRRRRSRSRPRACSWGGRRFWRSRLAPTDALRAAADLRVRGWRQKLDRRPASGRTHSQERHALPAFPEAAEQPVSTHLARIRVAQGKHSRHCGLSECPPAILPPGGSAHATIPFRQLPAAAFRTPPYASGNCCLAATSARRRARPANRDHRSPGNGPGHRSRAEDLHAGRKASCVPLAPCWANPGLPGWLPS